MEADKLVVREAILIARRVGRLTETEAKSFIDALFKNGLDDSLTTALLVIIKGVLAEAYRELALLINARDETKPTEYLKYYITARKLEIELLNSAIDALMGKWPQQPASKKLLCAVPIFPALLKTASSGATTDWLAVGVGLMGIVALLWAWFVVRKAKKVLSAKGGGI